MFNLLDPPHGSCISHSILSEVHPVLQPLPVPAHPNGDREVRVHINLVK
jgi:hypothetical protein